MVYPCGAPGLLGRLYPKVRASPSGPQQRAPLTVLRACDPIVRETYYEHSCGAPPGLHDFVLVYEHVLKDRFRVDLILILVINTDAHRSEGGVQRRETHRRLPVSGARSSLSPPPPMTAYGGGSVRGWRQSALILDMADFVGNCFLVLTGSGLGSAAAS